MNSLVLETALISGTLLMVFLAVLLFLFSVFPVNVPAVIQGTLKQAARKVGVVKSPRTVEQVIKSYGPSARRKWKTRFEKAVVNYPPQELVLVGLKDEESLLVFASDAESGIKKICEFPILGTSGTTGPKLKEGDFQMPEGFYKISSFNPNSLYHLALRVDYPNAEDRKHGLEDGRKKLGGDIMIHGKDCSIGCLAMGDSAIEELFTLVYDTGRAKTRVVLAPCDLTTKRPVIDMKKQPVWLPDLYKRLKNELSILFKAAL